MIVSRCLLCALSAAFVLSVNSPKLNIKGSKQSQIVGSSLHLEAPTVTKWDFKLFLSSGEKAKIPQCRFNMTGHISSNFNHGHIFNNLHAK